MVRSRTQDSHPKHFTCLPWITCITSPRTHKQQQKAGNAWKLQPWSSHHNKLNHNPVGTNLNTLPLDNVSNMLVFKTIFFRIIVNSLETGEKHAINHSLNKINVRMSALGLWFLINTSNPFKHLRKYSWKYVSKLPTVSPPKFSWGTKLRLLIDNIVKTEQILVCL